MITLFCLCASLWAQKNDKEALGWGVGAACAWMPDLLFIIAFLGDMH